jgi:hypothetical protein
MGIELADLKVTLPAELMVPNLADLKAGKQAEKMVSVMDVQKASALVVGKEKMKAD